jgi:uncharacterized protein YkwD
MRAVLMGAVFMRLPVVLAAALVLVLAPAVRASSPSADESLLDEINAVRAAHGLSALHPDGRLARAADSHTLLMIRTGVLQHGAFIARMREFHVSGRVGENLGWGVGPGGTAAALVEAWMRSAGHRANLLRPSFRRIGVSVVTTTFAGHADATVVTADFAG